MAFGVKPKFTVKGKQLAAAAGAGQASIRFTHIQMGDGTITTQAVSALTALINPVVTLPVTGISIGSNYAKLQTDFDNTSLTEGFYWREVGVFAEDPDTGKEILYCYGNCGELAEYISSAGEHTIRKIINVSAIIGDAENVTAEITDDTYYSPLDQLQEDITEEDMIPFFASLAGKKNILFKDFCEAIGVNIGMADFSSHILNKNNPHNVTKKQIGLEKAENTADSEKSVKYAIDADTVDGKHASFFAPSSNPTIDGTMTLTRSGATGTVQIFAYGNGMRIRVTDPSAEAETLTDLILTPTGIYTWDKLNGTGLAQTKINDGGNADTLDGYHLTDITLGTVNGNKPIVTSIISGDSAIRLSWTPIEGATAYAVSIYANEKYTNLSSSISGTNYTATGLINDQTYHFLVQAKVNGVWSEYTTADLVSAKPRKNVSEPTYFAGVITTGATAKTITTGKTPKLAIFLSQTENIGDVALTATGSLYYSDAIFTSTGITIEAQVAVTQGITYRYVIIC